MFLFRQCAGNPAPHNKPCLLLLLCAVQAPANLPSAVGVLVEEGPDASFLVKVNCRDRHGLLSDITQALGSLPLQVRGQGAAAVNCHDGVLGAVCWHCGHIQE